MFETQDFLIFSHLEMKVDQETAFSGRHSIRGCLAKLKCSEPYFWQQKIFNYISWNFMHFKYLSPFCRISNRYCTTLAPCPESLCQIRL